MFLSIDVLFLLINHAIHANSLLFPPDWWFHYSCDIHPYTEVIAFANPTLKVFGFRPIFAKASNTFWTIYVSFASHQYLNLLSMKKKSKIKWIGVWFSFGVTKHTWWMTYARSQHTESILSIDNIAIRVNPTIVSSCDNSVEFIAQQKFRSSWMIFPCL